MRVRVCVHVQTTACRAIGASADEAEEVAQDVFVAVHGRPDLDEVGALWDRRPEAERRRFERGTIARTENELSRQARLTFEEPITRAARPKKPTKGRRRVVLPP